jgi:branched-chain amino acid transport system ATP-binding protein
MEETYRLFPVLKERRQQPAGTLSGGEQQMLAVGRGLMADPKLLLLDEPSLGLAPILVTEIFNLLREINQRGVTTLLVEQNARKALTLADRAYVLETGRIIAEGPGAQLLEDPIIRKAYLGGA